MANHAFFYTLGKWMDGSGRYADIVLSSRVRLARNLSSISFTNSAHSELLGEVLLHISEAASQTKSFHPSTFFEVSNLSPLDRFIFLERHLISTELLTQISNSGIVIKKGEELSLMINEEDHLRLQSMKSGLDLEGAWEAADIADDELSSLLQFSFDKELGYLTACPTNVGTGMRASVLLHLPALVLTKQIEKAIISLFKQGCSIRGIYGEGTNIKGSFFQLSNTRTLGVSERDIINSLYDVVMYAIEFEEEMRNHLSREARYQIEDKIYRAFVILKNARILNSDETLNLLSAVRMGVSMKILGDIPMKILNKILIFSQPAHVQFFNNKETLTPEERDIKRAIWVRNMLEDY